ncbi:MAG TPA: tetratricopeptide repeat protein [Nitrospiria bacterium]|nr:tetratricopeptide repeat protein [Nitrospiria bacterium]
MFGKNLTPTTLIGVLTCIALFLIALILLDLQQGKPMEQTVNTHIKPSQASENAPEANAFPPSHTGPISLGTLAHSENKSHESVPGGMDAHDPIPNSSASHSILQDRTQLSSHKLYDKLSELIRQKREEEAIDILREIIRDDPGNLRAYALLGDLYYQNDRLPQAISVWQKILETEPSNEEVRGRLVKAQRESKTHQEFIHEATRHFRIKFEGSENRDLYKTVLDFLEEAYSEVGKALSFYPDHEIIVFLYTGQQFFDVTRAPAWSGGVFDGKIRIPAGGYQDHLDRLRRVLFHEYVHAVIRQMTDQGVSKVGERTRSGVPTWLHEGIAQYLEPDSAQNDVDRPLKDWVRQGAFLELSRLHGSFLGFNTLLADLAYDESLSAVKFLVDQFGPYSIQRVLTALAHQKTIDEAMRDSIFIPYDEFQSRWEKHLKS